MKEYDDVKIFGFWVYLMTDLVIFAVLFAAARRVGPSTSATDVPTGRVKRGDLSLCG